MKKILSFAAMATFLLASSVAVAQDNDKSKRPSPPAMVTQTLPSGATIKIDYSQPSVKGRVIGQELEPKDGTVWRMGANEATVFETDKEVKINGQALPAGKYSLFSLSGKDEWTIMFNKTWNQWGAYDYKAGENALMIKVKPTKAPSFAEKLKFTISKEGEVNVLWGDLQVGFDVK